MGIVEKDINNKTVYKHLMNIVHPITGDFRKKISKEKAFEIKKLNFRRWGDTRKNLDDEIRNLDFLKYFPNVKVLFFESDNLENIEGVSHLTEVVCIELESNWFGKVDVSPLGACKELEELTLNVIHVEGESNGEIVGLESLRDLQKMKHLLFHNIKLGEISFVEKMKELALVELENCLVDDLTPIQGKSNLETLTLRNCGINDISPLGTLENLKILDVAKNQIRDYSPLGKLENLETIVVDRTFSKEELQKMLGESVFLEEVEAELSVSYSGEILAGEEGIVEYSLQKIPPHSNA